MNILRLLGIRRKNIVTECHRSAMQRLERENAKLRNELQIFKASYRIMTERSRSLSERMDRIIASGTPHMANIGKKMKAIAEGKR